MTYAEVCESVVRLVKKHGTRDPIRLCHALDIDILYRSFGTAPNAIKGFFTEAKRIRTITVNRDLPEVIQKLIIAHELCHAIHHRKHGIQAFHVTSFSDAGSGMEKDANLFSAELVLEDQNVLEVLNQDTTFFSAAAQLYVPSELMDFKFRLLKWKGYKLPEPPTYAWSNFMKNMDVPGNADYYC